MKRIYSTAVVILVIAMAAPLWGASCEQVVRQLNSRLPVGLDEAELVEALRSLNSSANRTLPEKFVTKRAARAAGWRPGSSLWSVAALRGKSMGGDRFGNRERKLPDAGRKWREADLDYKGGHRGAKRLLFADDGLRMVTVDHYRTFTEVPVCR